MKSLRWTLALLLVAMTGMIACNDDDCPNCPDCPEPTAEFEVILHCFDEAGEPLANVAIGGMPALPAGLFPWGPNGAAAPAEKSRVDLRLAVSDTFAVRLAIRDVERRHVVTLYDAIARPGAYSVMWNGRTGAYVPTPPGYYEAVLSLQEEGAWVAVDSVALLHMAFDPGQYSYGLTDSSGRIVIRDRRLVPAFFDLMPLEAIDEDGNAAGSFSLTNETWLLCVTTDGRSEWAEFEAVDGQSQELTVQFQPLDSMGRSAPRGTASLGKEAARTKDERAWLQSPRPNPFN